MTTETDRVRCTVHGRNDGPYTWRIYRRRFRWFWHVIAWGEEPTLSAALTASLSGLHPTRPTRFGA